MGRPTLYRAEYAEQAYKLCLLNATEAEMANIFQVSEVTFNAWKAKHPALVKSIRDGREYADANVAERLYNRAMGYSHKAVKIFMPAGAAAPVYADYIEQYPPDTNAASLWLRNRQPQKWRDKIEHEHTHKREISELTREELLALVALAKAETIEHVARAPDMPKSIKRITNQNSEG